MGRIERIVLGGAVALVYSILIWQFIARPLVNMFN